MSKGVEWIRKDAIEEYIEERISVAFSPLAAQLVSLQTRFDQLLAVIEGIGEERGNADNDTAKTPGFDLLWGDPEWIKNERAKSLERRRKLGRVPFE